MDTKLKENKNNIDEILNSLKQYNVIQKEFHQMKRILDEEGIVYDIEFVNRSKFVNDQSCKIEHRLNQLTRSFKIE